MNILTKGWVDNYNKLSVVIVRTLFYFIHGVIGIVTIVTFVSQAYGINFILYSKCCVVIAFFGFVAFTFFIFKHTRAAIAEYDLDAVALIFITALCGAIITLIINRPDGDDYSYVPDAVYHLQNMYERMSFEIHYLVAPKPIITYLTATSHAYEYAQGVLAWLMGIPFLSVYYYVAPALAGFLIPLALYLLISCFSKTTRSAVLATIVTISIVVLLGETHRTFGNLSFNRAFQGKTWCLAIGIPCYAAILLDFLKRRTCYLWGLLFVTSTALVGINPTAIFLIPVLLMVVIVAYVIAQNEFKSNINGILLAGLSSIYIFIYAVYIKINSPVDMGTTNPVNKLFPVDFTGHLLFFINPILPLTPIVVLFFTVTSILVSNRKVRIFIITWILALVILFCNQVDTFNPGPVG